MSTLLRQDSVSSGSSEELFSAEASIVESPLKSANRKEVSVVDPLQFPLWIFTDEMTSAKAAYVGTEVLTAIDTKSMDMPYEVKNYFKALERVFKMNKLTDTEDELKVEIAEHYIGREVQRALEFVSDDEKSTYKKFKEAVTKRFVVAPTDAQARSDFMRYAMTPHQTTRDFLDEVKRMFARTSCTDEGEQKASILAAFTARHANPAVVKHFLDKPPKTIEDALRICDNIEKRQREAPQYEQLNRALVTANSAVAADGASGSGMVDAVTVRRTDWRPGGRGRTGRGGFNRRPPDMCGKCGRRPPCEAERCPGRNIKCYKCHRFGHFARYCTDRSATDDGGSGFGRGSSGRRVGECDVYEGGGDGAATRREMASFRNHGFAGLPGGGEEAATLAVDIQYQQMCLLEQRLNSGPPVSNYPYRPPSPPRFQMAPINSISMVSTPTHEDMWLEKAIIRKRTVLLKVDSGAKVNVLSVHHANVLGISKSTLRSTTIVLTSFQGDCVVPLGTVFLPVRLNGFELVVEFFVVPNCQSILLGFRDAVRFELIKRPGKHNKRSLARVHPIHEFTSYNREELHLVLTADAKPVCMPPRPIPLAKQEPVKKELDRMVAEGIIVPETEPSEWCSPILIRTKPNGAIRVCLDPKYLNQYLRRPLYPLPNIDTVFQRVQGAKIFTKLDLTQGFWHIRLDEESSRLCTFSTPFGRYRYLRMPFGISPGPEVFHRVMADVLKDIPNCMHYIDDVLMWSDSAEEHEKLVAMVLSRLKGAGFAVNMSKSEFRVPSVTYLGHIVSGVDVKPNPDRVRDVINFPQPKSKEDVKRLMGVTTYLAKFLPKFSEITEPIRVLLKKSVEFHWDHSQQQAFDRIKEKLVSAPVLALFDSKVPLVLATDASESGLGAVLVQRDRPVAYASRSLTDAERKYSTIEKELMAVVFGLERFNFYTSGRVVEVWTDHKPLVGLAQKESQLVSPRLVRFVERLLPYVIRWTYIPGHTNVLPDFLSRPSRDARSCSQIRTVETVSEVVEQRVHHPLFMKIAAASDECEQVAYVREAVCNGWPSSYARVPTDMRHWWHFRHRVSVSGPFITDTNNRVFVPARVRSDVLKALHEGHPGQSFMAQRYQELFFWPGGTVAVKTYGASCVTCAQHLPKPRVSPLLPRQAAVAPGDIVAADFFMLDGRSYLVFYDVFSKFPYLADVPRADSGSLVRCAQQFFTWTGCPREFWSDGGGAFVSDQFQQFLASCGTKFCPSSAEYPQSNGAAESAVKILKKLKQVSRDATSFFHNLLLLQNTVKPGQVVSPAQVFLGRKQRTRLHPDQVQNTFPWAKVQQQRKKEVAKMKELYDRRAGGTVKDDKFKTGMRVLVYGVRNQKGPVPATVVGKGSMPRSYVLMMSNGTQTTRSHRFLRLLPRSQPQIPAHPRDTFPIADKEVEVMVESSEEDEEHAPPAEPRVMAPGRIPEDPPPEEEPRPSPEDPVHPEDYRTQGPITRTQERNNPGHPISHDRMPTVAPTASGRRPKPSLKAMEMFLQTRQLPSGFLPEGGEGSRRPRS